MEPRLESEGCRSSPRMQSLFEQIAQMQNGGVNADRAIKMYTWGKYNARRHMRVKVQKKLVPESEREPLEEGLTLCRESM